ncbi:MAG: peptide chain release factor 2 [Planctomycetes bacterium]|nr:peptide chain release factor 2 [Planctomycetota bacterium]
MVNIDEIHHALKKMRNRLSRLKDSLDFTGNTERLHKIEKAMEEKGFWDDAEHANELIAELKRKKAGIEPVKELDELLEEADVMADLARDDGGQDAIAEANGLVKTLEGRFNKLELELMFDGDYDENNCYFSIQAGAGGTESCDWAQMLLRMYSRWMERRGYEHVVIDLLHEEEAGIKSATILVKGRLAYGYLKSEMGVHRLVRISPFDAQNRRHTSFAAVDVFPEVDTDIDLDIDPQDLKVDTYRAGGAGGQHVNKTDSAVRITHLPSGIVVQCQNERSQHKNRSTAMKMLKAKLFILKQKEQDEAMKGFLGEKSEIGWGRQIRSYILHPYSLIKDHRTNLEIGNVAAVLDGEIDGFIEEYLKGKIST